MDQSHYGRKGISGAYKSGGKKKSAPPKGKKAPAKPAKKSGY